MRFVSIYLLTLVSFGDAKFNVLMIAVDDLRPELHSYGIKGILTPSTTIQDLPCSCLSTYCASNRHQQAGKHKCIPAKRIIRQVLLVLSRLAI